jgi:hypothetical protein
MSTGRVLFAHGARDARWAGTAEALADACPRALGPPRSAPVGPGTGRTGARDARKRGGRTYPT